MPLTNTSAAIGQSKAVAAPILITNFASPWTKNSFSYLQGDDGTMTSVTLVATGVNIVSKANRYFYSVVTNGQACYSTTATYFRIIASGINAAGGSIRVSLGYDTSNIAGKCSSSASKIVTVSNWITDPTTGYNKGQIALLNLTGVNLDRLVKVAFENTIQPIGIIITLNSISFAFDAFSSSGSVNTTSLGKLQFELTIF